MSVMAKYKKKPRSYRRKKYYKTRRRSGDGGPLGGLVFLVVVLALLANAVGNLDLTEILSTNGSWLPKLTSGLLVVGLVVVCVVVYRLGRFLVRQHNLGMMSKQKEQQALNRYQSQKVAKQFDMIDPFEFEQFVSRVFAEQGYVTEVTQAQNDKGIDIVLTKDNERVAVQVKRYKGYVGTPEVRGFYGSFVDEGFDRGIFVTSSYFAKDAHEYAKGKKLELITGKQLRDMIDSLPA